MQEFYHGYLKWQAEFHKKTKARSLKWRVLFVRTKMFIQWSHFPPTMLVDLGPDMPTDVTDCCPSAAAVSGCCSMFTSTVNRGDLSAQSTQHDCELHKLHSVSQDADHIQALFYTWMSLEFILKLWHGRPHSSCILLSVNLAPFVPSYTT